MAYLTRTTLIELATLTDELELYDKIIFSTEDPDELNYYGMQPVKWNVIYKTKLLYEEDYIIAIGMLDGHSTIAKDIFILSGGNINDEDRRIEGIEVFLKEYYEKYMEKNKNGNIYLVIE
jgi:hypothetical protein